MLVQYGRPLGAHYLAHQATVISGAEQLDDAGRWPWYQQQQEEKKLLGCHQAEVQTASRRRSINRGGSTRRDLLTDWPIN